ncbi:MAG: hypothetical protein FWG10_05725 [Eubacteriaceae bacterium]|nr:hypothetical protein [Eubacteriaceae bacterium]
MVPVLKQGIGVKQYRLALIVSFGLAVLFILSQLWVANLFDDFAELPRQLRVFVVLFEIDFLINHRHVGGVAPVITPTASRNAMFQLSQGTMAAYALTVPTPRKAVILHGNARMLLTTECTAPMGERAAVVILPKGDNVNIPYPFNNHVVNHRKTPLNINAPALPALRCCPLVFLSFGWLPPYVGYGFS